MPRFNPIAIPDATTYAVKEYNSGIIHIVPDLTATCTISLPAAKQGLTYRFWYGGAATDGQNIVISTGSASNYYVGSVAFLTHGTADIEPVYSDGNSNSVLTVVTPAAGTWVEVICDGTVWYVNGQAVSATTPTIADA